MLLQAKRPSHPVQVRTGGWCEISTPLIYRFFGGFFDCSRVTSHNKTGLAM